MWASALKISFRTLYREKRYALINIAGLALAIACTIILGLYLRSELTYDRHWEGHENIYRVVNELTGTPAPSDDFAITSPMLGPFLEEDHSADIDAMVRFRWSNRVLFEGKSNSWDQTFASPNVFQVFKHDVIYGDPDTALEDRYSLAMSESVARSYFGDENPVGKVLTDVTGQPFTVTLVFADLPHNTHLKYDLLFSDNLPRLEDPTDLRERREMLLSVNTFTYVKMREDFNPGDWGKISNAFYEKHMREIAEAKGRSWQSWLQPLADIHLHSDLGFDEATANPYYNYAFITVAAFILLIACINYMNLSTARSGKRAREVGMRKILGASRSSLIIQFLTESILYALLAFIVGIAIVEVVLTLTPINTLLGKPLSLSLTGEPAILGISLGMCLLVGLLAGLYPALYLSSWQPLTALVGNIKSSTGSVRFRSALVFLQFSITVTVIASTLMMAIQMRYISNLDLGYNKENMLVVDLRGVDVVEKIPVIREELMTHPNILGVTTSDDVMGWALTSALVEVETESGKMQETIINKNSVYTNFIDVMGLELVAGRGFDTRSLTDASTNVVVNETMVKNMGWSEPLGKRIEEGRVIGVVKDFNYTSLHIPIKSFVLFTLSDNQFEDVEPELVPLITRPLWVRIAGDDVRGTLNYIEEQMLDFAPKNPFEFRFFDDILNQRYQSEERLMKLVGIFSVICIFIACLGLYGLAAFTTEQRTKEIGIRKVLGASSIQIISLLAKNMLGLVAAGAALATVISYLAINEWLSDFAYRAAITPLPFLVATLAALAIAYTTIALEAVKTARSDPALSLNHE